MGNITRRSLRSIRTAGTLADRRRSRTPAGALLELSALAYERDLLQRELDRWATRLQEIQARLAEIQAKEESLQRVATRKAGTRPSPTPTTPLRTKDFEY